MTDCGSYYTAAELAALGLPGLPGSRYRIQDYAARHHWKTRRSPDGTPLWRRRKGRGGGIEWNAALLPSAAQLALAGGRTPKPDPQQGRAEAWDTFNRLPQSRKDEAAKRLAIIQAVLMMTTLRRTAAVKAVAARHSITPRTIHGWLALIKGHDPADWLAYLAPRHVGGGKAADIPDEAWRTFKADYLRPEQPTIESCYRRLQVAGKAKGWYPLLPPARTFARRLEREVDVAVRTLARGGVDALRRLYPYQDRDRASLHALEGINADGWKADVMVRWPDGKTSRPHVVMIQDLHSGKLLAWRVDRDLTATAVRLAFYDLFRYHGIPDFAVLDNGREFAAKMITGGQPTRFRFQTKPDDLLGILTALNIKVHWTTPGSGQSKPIERAFGIGGLADDFAKHPAFAGAYTGNSPENKPANYGARAVSLEHFCSTLTAWVAEANARTGRRSHVAQGRSFDEVYAASYANAIIRRATREQLTMAMLAAEAVTARKPDGSVHLYGSRFWDTKLTPYIGKRLAARFDPEDLGAGVHIYRSDGTYLCHAANLEPAPFLSVDAARAHKHDRNAYVKHTKAATKLERAMTPEELAAALPKITPEPSPPPKVTKLVARGGGQPIPAADPAADTLADEEHLAAINRVLHLVTGGR
ncbi:MAG: transposase domain-containing protein [Pseudomonadota bacterium]